MSKNLKKIITLLIISVLCFALVGCNKPTSESVLKQLEEEKYKEFTESFEKLSEAEKSKVVDKLIEEAELIVQDFIDSDLKKESYDVAIEKLNILMPKSHESDKKDIISKLDELYEISNNSYMAHEEGLDYINKGDYEKALEKFAKVSVEHPIYAETKVNIELANKELEQLKPPPVEVANIRLSRDLIDNQVANVQFTNISDKVIKEIQFSVFAYDKNRYPVKVQFNYDEYLNCKFDHTLQPGETSNADFGWDLYNEGTEITELVVSIYNVDFYEDDIWENPMYSSDLEKYVGKPLK